MGKGKHKRKKAPQEAPVASEPASSSVPEGLLSASALWESAEAKRQEAQRDAAAAVGLTALAATTILCWSGAMRLSSDLYRGVEPAARSVIVSILQVAVPFEVVGAGFLAFRARDFRRRADGLEKRAYEVQQLMLQPKNASPEDQQSSAQAEADPGVFLLPASYTELEVFMTQAFPDVMKAHRLSLETLQDQAPLLDRPPALPPDQP